jgi:hypothetical protein
VDLDNAVLQTGEALSGGCAGPNDKNDSIQEAMTTFGAIPTTTKRRVRLVYQPSVNALCPF